MRLDLASTAVKSAQEVMEVPDIDFHSSTLSIGIGIRSVDFHGSTFFLAYLFTWKQINEEETFQGTCICIHKAFFYEFDMSVMGSEQKYQEVE